jgi:hypothetical protein
MDELGLLKSSSPYQLGDGMCSPHRHSLKDERGLSSAICITLQRMNLVSLKVIAPTKSLGMVCVLPIDVVSPMLYTPLSKG